MDVNPKDEYFSSLDNKTCILFFSNSARHEARSKKYSPSYSQSQNQKIASSLIKRTLSLIKKSELPYLQIDEFQQVGKTFGCRLSNAVDLVFSTTDYQSLIILGNDCLELSANDIKSSASLLEQGREVLGGTQLNGAYLIGIQKSQFDKLAFKNIGWKTKTCLNDLQSYFSSTIHQFDPKIECNHLKSLSHISSTFVQRFLSRFLSFIKLDIIDIPQRILHNPIQLQTPVLRGPPSFI